MGSRASVDVGDKHLREVVTLAQGYGAARLNGGSGSVALLLGTLDGDGSAVHVELAVANAVDPSPGKSILARLDAGWDLELEFGRAVAVRILGQIAGGIGWTSTLDGVNDLPHGVFGGLHILGEGDLARAAAMDSRANELKRGGLADGEDVLLLWGSVDTLALLAREVGQVVLKGAVVEGGSAIGIGDSHLHVGVNTRGDEGSNGCNGADREMHFVEF